MLSRHGQVPLIRSLLLCTTTFERHVQAALASAADAVVLDLETTIAEPEKDKAGRAAARTLASAGQGPGIYVRINQIDSPHILDDLLALQTPNLRGVMLPQAEASEQIVALDWMLSRLEQRYPRNGAPVEILPLIESAKGVENLMQVLAASKRIRQATFGIADYSLDTGLHVGPDEAELSYIRDRLGPCRRAR